MTADLTCRDERRRQLIRERSLNGIDYVDVEGSHLCVHFLTGIPADFLPKQKNQPMTFDDKTAAMQHIVISGGRRVRNIQVTSIDPEPATNRFEESCLGIELDKEGDWSTYTLCFVETKDGVPTDQPLRALDPRYACIDFVFHIDCPAQVDCAAVASCPPEPRVEPAISYLAKDYATFRQLILDRLAVIMPSWRERHVPDIGIALVELLAYAGDYLSYYQDAVATEQYLDTARLRISVRRHARLVDYAMHEGCNARAFVQLQVQSDVDVDPREIYFTTSPPHTANVPLLLREPDFLDLAPGAVVFEVVSAAKTIPLREKHNLIHIYTWGDEECCLPKGATRATLVDDGLELAPGDFLLFEELACLGTAYNLDPEKPEDGGFDGHTPQPDADRTHRWVVRLTKVTPGVDDLLRTQILDVEWGDGDALPFALCLSGIGTAPECDYVRDIAVARGNVVLVDNGRTIRDEPLDPVQEVPSPATCDGVDDLAEVAHVAKRYRPVLQNAPLTFSQPVDPSAPASSLLQQDPRAALPAVVVWSTPPQETPGPPTKWTAQYDLIESGSDEADFVAEIDDDGRAHLRFGDGDEGRAVDVGATFVATYRAGNGRAGLVGGETIAHAVFRNGFNDAITAVRNPLPAAGAIDPEPIAEVKMFAPEAFRNDIERAVTAADYATLAEYLRFPQRNPRVQSAAANLRWTGSWYEADVAVDAFGSAELDPALQQTISGSLYPARRMGHDLRVSGADIVALRLILDLCIDPEYLRAHVVAAVADALSSRALPDGRLGFFHPDNLTFGQSVYVSRIVAAVMKVDGVLEVHVVQLQRLDEDVLKHSNPDLAKGFLKLGPTEVARLDNDPANPENGILTFRHVRGGR